MKIVDFVCPSFPTVVRIKEMRIKAIGCPGRPNVLRIKEVPKPTLRSHEIMIQVAAAGLNVYDTWRRQDIPFYRYGFSKYPGYECSGKVVAVGSDVIKFKKGDEVCAILHRGGAYAEFVVAPEIHVLQIPSGVSLVEAAALPEASRLIFYALSVLVNVTPGKTILIHGAAAGIDIFAIQYAKHIGCEVFVVAGMEEKLKLCKMLGAQVCINYKKEDFCKRVKAETGEKGVDIILDVSGRDHFQKNLDCLTRGGSLVILGQRIGDEVDIDLSFLVKNDVSVIGADIAKINYPDIEKLMSDAAAKFWPLIEAGHIKPIIGKIFTFTEATKAHRALEESSIPGKLLLVPPKATACDIHSPTIQGPINRFSDIHSPTIQGPINRFSDIHSPTIQGPINRFSDIHSPTIQGPINRFSDIHSPTIQGPINRFSNIHSPTILGPINRFSDFHSPTIQGPINRFSNIHSPTMLGPINRFSALFSSKVRKS